MIQRRTMKSWVLLLPLLIHGAPFLSQAQSAPLAFPGAEGFGRFATGGRGGEVYHVTHLKDSGAGSFREAVSRPGRTVVFDVSGVITIASRISVAPNITIAGQTAPGDGVVIYGNGISFSGANNAIVRHIRFRMGVKGDSGKDAVTIANGHDMIFDHISVSWGRDENFSISGLVTNITIQDSIIAQGLQPHSAGGLIQTPGGVSILRSLYIDNHTRNPKVKGRNQFINNVVYNWGGGGGYILGDSESDSFANVANNYFINGPSTAVAAFSRANAHFHLYASGNYQDSNRNGKLDGDVVPQSAYGPVSWQGTPFDYAHIAGLAPAQVFLAVASQAGASARRDATDQQLIRELLSLGTMGETIRNENDPPMNGVGTIQNEPCPADTDRDGLPDFWERAMGLNPANPDDCNQRGDGGYTRLETYLNWLAAPHLIAEPGRATKTDLRSLARGLDSVSFRILDTRNCSASLSADAHSAEVTPGKGFTGLAEVRVALRDGAEITNTVAVLVPAEPAGH
jgi:pectate lyase